MSENTFDQDAFAKEYEQHIDPLHKFFAARHKRLIEELGETSDELIDSYILIGVARSGPQRGCTIISMAGRPFDTIHATAKAMFEDDVVKDVILNSTREFIQRTSGLDIKELLVEKLQELQKK